MHLEILSLQDYVASLFFCLNIEQLHRLTVKCILFFYQYFVFEIVEFEFTQMSP